MPHNVLFNYLNDQNSIPVVKSISQVQCRKKITVAGVRYFLLDINESIGAIIGNDPETYRLNNHHVSVYPIEYRSNPFMSQYHYTAEFNDSQGRVYRLHVYFNDKGGIASDPVFEVRDDSGEYRPFPAEQYHKEFTHLAKFYTQPIIATLKKGLNTHIETLEATFKGLESEAYELSRNLSMNGEAYIHKLDAACQASQALVPFLSNPAYYQGLLIWFQQLRRAIERQYSIEQTSVAETTECEEALPSPTIDVAPVSQSLQPAQPVSADLEIRQLYSNFTALTQEPDQSQSIRLSEISAQMHALFLLIESQHLSVSLSSLSLLQKLHYELHTSNQSLYKRLLAARNVEGMRHLSDFHYLIEDKHLIFALLRRDDAFFEFILECGNFDIDKPVIIKGKEYSSAVLYCFNAHTDAAPMGACLAVLLKHGASLFIEDANGLPIAHNILSIPNHPLISVLIDSITDQSKKAGVVKFYKELIVTLQRYLEKNPQDTLGINLSIRNAISKYEDQVTKLSAGYSSASDAAFFSKTEATFRAQVADKMDIQRLEQEPEIIAARRKMMTAYNSYIKLLSRKESRDLSLKTKEIVNEGYFTSLAENIPVGTPYEVLKESALQELGEHTEHFENRARLLDIQKQLMVPFYGSASKQRKALAKEERMLVEQINRHEKVTWSNGFGHPR